MQVATNARSRFVERAKVLIEQRACDLSASCARNFCRLGTTQCRDKTAYQLCYRISHRVTQNSNRRGTDSLSVEMPNLLQTNQELLRLEVIKTKGSALHFRSRFWLAISGILFRAI